MCLYLSSVNINWRILLTVKPIWFSFISEASCVGPRKVYNYFREVTSASSSEIAHVENINPLKNVYIIIFLQKLKVTLKFPLEASRSISVSVAWCKSFCTMGIFSITYFRQYFIVQLIILLRKWWEKCR